MEKRHYKQPDWFTRHIANPLVMTLTRSGLSIRGSRVLEVRGRRTGEPRRVPVNPLQLEDTTYLVAPRGETEWVRNVRAAGGRLTLIQGRRRREFTATEIPDADKPELLRQYLVRWKAETGIFFDGVGPDSTHAELAAIAGRHPVFRLEPAPSTPDGAAS
ncbi:MAG TPA: nitroreductase family deazaflavin-dependent oxidoreductase [Acidimicrobiales bacterium]|nr:nitroreductase family deazaflavin-dependent oxidoreductase [Acidimicrobiales bacterium]